MPEKPARKATGFASLSRNAILALVACLIAAIASVAQLASGFLERANPLLATQLWSSNDDAWTNLGAQQVARIPNIAELMAGTQKLDRNSKELRHVTLSSRAALTTNPAKAAALRNLAYIEIITRNSEQAAALVGRANRSTRRDIPTQMLMTRQKIIENDIPAALHSFDVALRIDDDARSQLFPVAGRRHRNSKVQRCL